jgi:hypothetical protein
MKKIIFMAILCAISIGIVFSKDTPAFGNIPRSTKFAWVKDFFFDAGTGYNYTSLEPLPKFQSHNLLMRVGLGYDFGRITARIYGDFGFLLYGQAYWSDGISRISSSLDASNGKLGLESAFKVIDSSRVDVIIPLGFLFNWTKYTGKNPSYTSGNVPYDRVWKYSYTHIFSGVNIAFKINNHFQLMIFGNIGYPIAKKFEYQEILRGNYVWTSTGTDTATIKSDVDVFAFSAGINARMNL